MNERETRRIALDMARADLDRSVAHGRPEIVIERARLYADFMIGTNDAELRAGMKALAEKL